MDFRTYENRLSYILELIEKQRLRSIGDVAKRFECSNRTVKRMLTHLREQGHDIQYDRLQKKFILKKSG
ncbi:MAG TPA: HTH domain-containing protein [Candidatus Babeliaceae bacterium]|nr:HTH domain-containing protein [Candidatus Babeliaceae bacterium]